MIETLAQQVASQLTPVLPYLISPTAIATKDAAVKAAGGKVGEAAWNKAVSLWNKLRLAVEKEPEAAKALQEVAQKPGDPRAEEVLSWQLEKVLASMPSESLNEIQNILGENKNGMRIVTAMNRSIAIGGNASGNIISTGDRGTK